MRVKTAALGWTIFWTAKTIALGIMLVLGVYILVGLGFPLLWLALPALALIGGVVCLYGVFAPNKRTQPTQVTRGAFQPTQITGGAFCCRCGRPFRTDDTYCPHCGEPTLIT